MAWKAKPSATTQIETRSEPYLTGEIRLQYTAELLPRYEQIRGALMPILHDVQDRYGYIPHQAMVEIAEFLGLQPADVLDTASFYEEYHTEPVGEHVIGVCQSVACEICGHMTLLDHLRKRLGIEPHETTPDGKFTLLAMECLGACDGAPCALIDDDRYDNLTIPELAAILDKLSV